MVILQVKIARLKSPFLQTGIKKGAAKLLPLRLYFFATYTAEYACKLLLVRP